MKDKFCLINTATPKDSNEKQSTYCDNKS